ncbi:MAG: S26 family signal peptidase [Haloferacaceae archaeon]
MVVREALISIAIVALVGLLLFALSGVWPPMVAVESGSMEPHMYRGDLVFVSTPGRYVPDGSARTRGIVTETAGERIDYRTFGGYGSVIVYDSPARSGPPVIHRARFWVDDGENWYDKADPSYIAADSCRELPNCPAPHAGFITKGDANGEYDQVNGIAGPVRPTWITGVAHVRVPYLGYVRLWLAEGQRAPLVVGPGSGGTSGGAVVVGPGSGVGSIGGSGLIGPAVWTGPHDASDGHPRPAATVASGSPGSSESPATGVAVG